MRFLIVLSCFLLNVGLITSNVLAPSKGFTNDLISLNGQWKFQFYQDSITPSDALFYQKDFSFDAWSFIQVPGNWELQGFSYPTYGKKPNEGVGVYATTFTIPKDWKKSPVYIAFDGVQSGYTFWINGKEVGTFASSFNRKTFDITAYLLTNKPNQLAVKVDTHVKGYEFDTNDDWTLMGIFRDVTVFRLPPNHIKDFVVQTFVKDNHKAEVKLKVDLGITSKLVKNQLKLTGQLLDKDNFLVGEFSFNEISSLDNTQLLESTVSLKNPNLWNAETPYLYTLKLKLSQKKKILQEHTEKVGIREVTCDQGVFKLNGTPIKLRGINHHDLSPVNGRAITKEELKEDLELMKQSNVNYVRTAHYPPNYHLLELCDSMGFYVIDEVAFGYAGVLVNDSSYLPLMLTRVKATYDRDKNRPSVIAWSIGNENPFTQFNLEAARYMKRLDATRPNSLPQTPGVFKQMIEQGIPDSIDMLDVHYAEIPDLLEYAERFEQPLLMGEYAHALGLDFGGLESYFEIMNEKPKLVGGAVWMFSDQGILRKYDGQLSEKDSLMYVWKDKNSYYDTGGVGGIDGMVYANRVPSVNYFELRKVYTPIKALEGKYNFQAGSYTANFKFVNRNDFTNLDQFTCKWELFSNSAVIDSGPMKLNCLPRDTATFNLKLALPNEALNQYYIRFSFTNPQGLQVYEKTFELERNTQKTILSAVESERKRSNPNKADNQLSSKFFEFKYDKLNRDLSINNAQGISLIQSFFARVGRKPSITQVATMTTKRRQGSLHSLWTPFMLSNIADELVKFDDNEFTYKSFYRADTVYVGKKRVPEVRELSAEINFRFDEKGYIGVDYLLTPIQGKGDATDMGISFLIPENLTEFRWIGDGPYESYPNKKNLNDYGVYHLNKDDLYFPGNRSRVNCAVFSDLDGNGFALISDHMNISVEKTEKGINVAHNALVSGRFSKYVWPENMYAFEVDEPIGGSFTIVPFSKFTWPGIFKSLFGNATDVVKPFNPFFHSYDQ